jgi:hypothetical protein
VNDELRTLSGFTALECVTYFYGRRCSAAELEAAVAHAESIVPGTFHHDLAVDLARRVDVGFVAVVASRRANDRARSADVAFWNSQARKASPTLTAWPVAMAAAWAKRPDRIPARTPDEGPHQLSAGTEVAAPT